MTETTTALNIPVWKCRTCGCLWRDNLDDSVSLFDATQKSCASCEPRPVREACEIHWLKLVPAAALAASEQQTQQMREALTGKLIGTDALLVNALVVVDGEGALRLVGARKLVADCLAALHASEPSAEEETAVSGSQGEGVHVESALVPLPDTAAPRESCPNSECGSPVRIMRARGPMGSCRDPWHDSKPTPVAEPSGEQETPPMKAWTLRQWVQHVVDKFTRDEAQGFRSRDRQYAIAMLGKALEMTADPPATETLRP